MDQFSAHLDRGWDLVQRGDARGAEVSARRALEIDNQSPEAYNLLGYVGALQGEFEDAVDAYRHAIALDDTYLEAMLNAAEVYIHPLAEYDEALNLCDTALDLAQNDDEIVDALLLKFDALLGLNRLETAKVLCQRFPPGPFTNPNHTFLVGRALYEVGEVERAAPLVEQAAKETPTNPEASYYLGLVRDERGDTPGATQAFLRSRELDLALPQPSWTLTRETFEHTVGRVIDSLVPALKVFLQDAAVFVADMPGVEVVVDGVDPRALLLLDSLPPAVAAAAAAASGIEPPPESDGPLVRLFVYQRNVERLAGALENIEPEFKAALEREISATFVERRLPNSSCVD